MVRERQNGSAFVNSPTPSPKALLIPSEAENPRRKLRGFFSPPAYHSVMNQNDDRLRALLKQWRDIEPTGNFEANVWRRIRVATDKRPERMSLMEAVGRLLWQPAWSVAIALFVAAIVGVWGGVASTSRPADTSRAELQFLAPGTLAGSYLQGAAKESP
jgi:hypothetical protein